MAVQGSCLSYWPTFGKAHARPHIASLLRCYIYLHRRISAAALYRQGVGSNFTGSHIVQGKMMHRGEEHKRTLFFNPSPYTGATVEASVLIYMETHSLWPLSRDKLISRNW